MVRHSKFGTVNGLEKGGTSSRFGSLAFVCSGNMASLVCYIALLATTVTVCLAGKQSITVTAEFKCGDKPTTSKDTWVKLLNKRTGFDDTTEKPVNDDGTVSITLQVDRWFDLTPELHVYTDCDDVLLGIPKGCQRKLKLKIPEKYVNKGPYDAGRYNLEMCNSRFLSIPKPCQFEDEDRDCSPKRSWNGK